MEVELTGLVGIYSRLGNHFNSHIVLFTAKQIGGEIKCQPGETIAVEWFRFDYIPKPLAIGHKRRIEDAITGKDGTVVLQEIHLPAGTGNLSREELMELQDKSGLSRQEFYIQFIEQAELKEKVEVGHIEHV